MGKPVKYAAVPAYFDETKNYIVQLPPVDMGDYIFVDVMVKDLPVQSETVVDNPQGNFEPYVAEPSEDERLKACEDAISALMGV